MRAHLRPEHIDAAHDFGPEPDWILLPRDWVPRCGTCGLLATEPHDPDREPAPVPIPEPADLRRYQGD